MNINLRTIEIFMSLITMFVAYIITETTSGFFRAWVAKKVGDEGPEYNGFLSLNPLVHIDFIGVFFLFIYNFGWGRYIPINHLVIQEPWQKLKITLAYFSDTFARIMLALIALVILLQTFGFTLLELAKPMILNKHIALPILAHFYPDKSSLALTLAVILAGIMYLCILLAVLNFIINCVRLIILFYFHESLGAGYLEFFIPILLIILLADPLQHIAIESIVTLAYHITRLLHGSFV